MVSMRDSKILAATMNVSNDAGRDGFHSVPDLARAALRRKDQGRSGIRPYRFMVPMRVRFWRWRLPMNRNAELRFGVGWIGLCRIGVRRSAIGFMATTRVQSLD